MSKSGRIVSAIALGGILGMAVALIMPQIIWWLGAVAGGLIGGFVYALPDIVHYAPEASRTAWRDLARIHPQGGLRITGKIIAATLRTLLFSLGIWPKMSISQRLMAAICWISLILFSVALYHFLSLVETTYSGWLVIYFILLSFYEVFLLCLITRAYWGGSLAPIEGVTSQEILAARKKVLFYVTPVGTIFLISRYLARTIPQLAILFLQVSWESVKFLAKFIKTLYILVHSKELVLVGLDTALGITITYLLFVRQGDPILGVGPTLVLSGFISVLLGYFLDYQVISRRILHLNGQKA